MAAAGAVGGVEEVVKVTATGVEGVKVHVLVVVLVVVTAAAAVVVVVVVVVEEVVVVVKEVQFS